MIREPAPSTHVKENATKEKKKEKKKKIRSKGITPSGGLEPPTSR
jgi:hypothetical protein